MIQDKCQSLPAHARAVTAAAHGVSDSETQSIVRRLKNPPETEYPGCGQGQQLKGTDNGHDKFYEVSALPPRILRHLSLQYFTSSQTFAHFFRHRNTRPQEMQIFSGKLDF